MKEEGPPWCLYVTQRWRGNDSSVSPTQERQRSTADFSCFSAFFLTLSFRNVAKASVTASLSHTHTNTRMLIRSREGVSHYPPHPHTPRLFILLCFSSPLTRQPPSFTLLSTSCFIQSLFHLFYLLLSFFYPPTRCQHVISYWPFYAHTHSLSHAPIHPLYHSDPLSGKWKTNPTTNQGFWYFLPSVQLNMPSICFFFSLWVFFYSTDYGCSCDCFLRLCFNLL